MPTKAIVTLIVELRLLIGLLGEKAQYHWWDSHFMSATSTAFLAPVFSRTLLLAQYHGVCEAAMRVHDEHIGVGTHFHLYRLPDALERAAAKKLTDGDHAQSMPAVWADGETALARLNRLAVTVAQTSEGPVVVGRYADADLKALLHQAAYHYLQAFHQGYRCFPYMRAVE